MKISRIILRLYVWLRFGYNDTVIQYSISMTEFHYAKNNHLRKVLKIKITKTENANNNNRIP